MSQTVAQALALEVLRDLADQSLEQWASAEELSEADRRRLARIHALGEGLAAMMAAAPAAPEQSSE